MAKKCSPYQPSSIFSNTTSHRLPAPKPKYFLKSLGVLVLLKLQVNSQKLGVQAPQNLEFEKAIAMLKCENPPRTNSTKSENQNNFGQMSAKRVHPCTYPKVFVFTISPQKCFLPPQICKKCFVNSLFGHTKSKDVLTTPPANNFAAPRTFSV